ncbi:MAG: PAS domain S-box protein [Blastocatellia bacterium]|nr:PAS domain S-box protein [Blastocatellia bacterium]
MKVILPLRLRIPVIVFLFGLCAIFFNYRIDVDQRMKMQEQATLAQLNANGIRLAGMAQYFGARADLDGANMEMGMTAALPDLRIGVICDATDRILLSTEYRWRGQPLTDSPLGFAASLTAKVRLENRPQIEYSPDRRWVTGAFPYLTAPPPGQLNSAGVGVALLQFDLSRSMDLARREATREALIVGAILMLLCLVLWGVLHFTMVAGVGRLVQATREIAGGNLHATAALNDGDELSQISEAVDRMALDLRQYVEALRASQDRLRDILTSIEDIVWSSSIDASEIFFINPAAERIYGRPIADFYEIPQLWQQLVHPEDQALVEKAFLDLESATSFDVEYRIVRPNGEVRWLHDRGRILIEPNGKPPRLDGIARDITRRRQAEEALRASESRFAGIVATAMDAIIAIDAEQRVTLFNAAAERMFQCPAAEAIGQPLDRFLPAPFRESHAARIDEFGRNNVSSRGMGSSSTVHGLRADGTAFPMEASISQLSVDRQKIYTVILRDVTERKRSEAQLIEQAALLNQTMEAIISSDLDGRIIFWNRGAERVYGWTAEEVVGRNIKMEWYRGDSAKADAAWQELIAQGQWTGELQQYAKDGRRITIDGHWTRVSDESGRPKSILIVNYDITEKKLLESQFLRAQRMESIGTLAGGIAHDLNNVLSPIMMAMQLLQARWQDEDSQRILSVLISNVERGADMVKQVLSFARGTSGERVALQPVHLIKEIVKIMKETFPKSIEIRFQVPADLWMVNGDATQLHQVLMNLCVNARDAMALGGTLRIEAENIVIDDVYARMVPNVAAGRHVRISVADTGDGIPAEILDRIFDPFFTTKDQGKGTGLGLSTVMAIVHGHGGFINVQSEVGRGTTFRIHLRALETAELRPAPLQTHEMPRGNGEWILVVDDEAAIREIATSALEAFGYHVLTAGDGAEAIALFVQHRERIRVVVTDMMMPYMDGAATIQALLRLAPELRILGTSGLEEGGKRKEALDAGAQAFIPKPYTAETLLKSLATLLQS